jgi:hypothetical protein
VVTYPDVSRDAYKCIPDRSTLAPDATADSGPEIG